MPATTRSSRRGATRRGSGPSEELNDESEKVEYSGEDEYDDEQSVEAEHDEGFGAHRRRSARQRKPTSKATEATIERIAATRKRNPSNKSANSDAESGYDDNYESEEGMKAKGSNDEVLGILKGRRSPIDRENENKVDDNTIRNQALNKTGGKSRHNTLKKASSKSAKSTKDAKKGEFDDDIDHSEELDSSESTQYDKLESEKDSSLSNNKISKGLIVDDSIDMNNAMVDASVDQKSKSDENDAIGNDVVETNRLRVDEIVDQKFKSNDRNISTGNLKSAIKNSNKGEVEIVDQKLKSNEHDPTVEDRLKCTSDEIVDKKLLKLENDPAAEDASVIIIDEDVPDAIEANNLKLDEITAQNVKSNDSAKQKSEQDAQQVYAKFDNPFDTGNVTTNSAPEDSKEGMDEGKIDTKKTDAPDSTGYENEEAEDDNSHAKEQIEFDTKRRDEASDDLSSNEVLEYGKVRAVELLTSGREDDILLVSPTESIKQKNDCKRDVNANEEKDQPCTMKTKSNDKGIESIGSSFLSTEMDVGAQSTEAQNLNVATSHSVTGTPLRETEIEIDRVSTGSKRRSKRDKDRSLITSEVSESDSTDVDNYVDALQTNDIELAQRKVLEPKELDDMDSRLKDESSNLKKSPKSDRSNLNKPVVAVNTLKSDTVSTLGKANKRNLAETDLAVEGTDEVERSTHKGEKSEKSNRFETLLGTKHNRIRRDGEIDDSTITKKADPLNVIKADNEKSYQNQKETVASESLPENNKNTDNAIGASDSSTTVLKNDENKSLRSEHTSPIHAYSEDLSYNNGNITDRMDNKRLNDSKSSTPESRVPSLDEGPSSSKEKTVPMSSQGGRTDAEIRRTSPGHQNQRAGGSERNDEFSRNNQRRQADPLNKSIKSCAQIQKPPSAEVNRIPPNENSAPSVESPGLVSTNDETIKLQNLGQEARSMDVSSTSTALSKNRFETKTNEPDVTLTQQKLKGSLQKVEKEELKPSRSAQVSADDVKQEKSDSVLQCTKRKRSGPDIAERPPKQARIQLENMKLIIFAAGRRVHNGPGYERLFAEYWDAISSRITGNLSTSQMHRNRLVINTFLKSKMLRKIHNQLILGIIARCFQPIVKSEVATLAPDAWLPRINVSKPPTIETSQSLELRLKKDIEDSPIAANPSPYHMPLYQSLQSKCFPPEKNQSSAPLRIPGAIVVDPLFRSVASNEGLKVNENAVWLLVIAMKEYTLSLLRDTVGFVKELKQLDAPSRPVMQPPPPSKKRSREPPVASLQEEDQVTTISAKHVHAFTASSANTIRSRGNNISRTTYERGLHKLDNHNLSLTPEDFIPIKDFFAATIMLPEAKRVKSELPSTAESNFGKSDLSTQASAHMEEQSSPVRVISSSQVPVSAVGAKSTPKKLSISSPSQSDRNNKRPQPVGSDLYTPEKNHNQSDESPLPATAQTQSNRPKTPTRGGLGRGAKDLASLLARSRTGNSSSDQATPPPTDTNKNKVPDSKPVSAEDVPVASKSNTSTPNNASIKVETATGDSQSTTAQRRGKGFGLKNLATMMARSIPTKPDEK